MHISENMAEYMKNRRKSRRQDLLDLSKNKCAECDSIENLEFNHVDRNTKDFVLSGHNLDKSWKRILEEHSKCELLCIRHHREKTKIQYETRQIIQWNDKKDKEFLHGTVRCYQETKCKCYLCKYAKKLYRQKKISYDEVVNFE